MTRGRADSVDPRAATPAERRGRAARYAAKACCVAVAGARLPLPDRARTKKPMRPEAC